MIRYPPVNLELQILMSKVQKNIQSRNYFVASLWLFCVNILLNSVFVATNATLMTPSNELFTNELREVWQRCNKKIKIYSYIEVCLFC